MNDEKEYMTQSIANLVGGPHDERKITLDARLHGATCVEGHWYFRALPQPPSWTRTHIFDYMHSPKCCDR